MDAGSPQGFRHQPVWCVAALVLTLGQGALALQLFGVLQPWNGLLDSRPIVEGRHPLHLYHGILGAQTFAERATTCCYDPAFQAGYPKTPVFDSSARVAELAQYLGGASESARPYKFAVWIICLMVPLALLGAARGFAVPPAGAMAVAVLGCFVWWSPPVRDLLNAGHLDLLCAGLAVLVFLGGLVRYTADPGVTGWLLLAGASLVLWSVTPLLVLGLTPIVLGYYLIVAPRHGLAWHLGLIAVPFVGAAPNLWWLGDWLRFWWLRQPLADGLVSVPSPSDYFGQIEQYQHFVGTDALSLGLTLSGLIGLFAMARRGVGLPVLVILATLVLAILAARLGEVWLPARILHLQHAALLIPGMALLGLGELAGRIARTSRWLRIGAGGLAVLPLLMSGAAWGYPEWGFTISPLRLGLSFDHQQLVERLRQHTTPEARILIEEADVSDPCGHWTALLPLRTQRVYLGGLDAEAKYEHLFCRMQNGQLAGRRFADWTQPERRAFCQRYNVGWVVCRTREAIAWWQTDPVAREVARGSEWNPFVLFEIRRPHSYVLAGSAQIARADRGKIVLTDVVPNEAGEVILSFHFQPELRVAPLVVEVARAPDPHDPIPLLKLRLPGPVSRVTLTWERP